MYDIKKQPYFVKLKTVNHFPFSSQPITKYLPATTCDDKNQCREVKAVFIIFFISRLVIDDRWQPCGHPHKPKSTTRWPRKAGNRATCNPFRGPTCDFSFRYNYSESTLPFRPAPLDTNSYRLPYLGPETFKSKEPYSKTHNVGNSQGGLSNSSKSYQKTSYLQNLWLPEAELVLSRGVEVVFRYRLHSFSIIYNRISKKKPHTQRSFTTRLLMIR